MHFTLKQRRMKRADLDEFVSCYNPENRHQRKATLGREEEPEGRWRAFTYEELIARDKCSLDIFWLKDESLEDSARPARAARPRGGNRRGPAVGAWNKSRAC